MYSLAIWIIQNWFSIYRRTELAWKWTISTEQCHVSCKIENDQTWKIDWNWLGKTDTPFISTPEEINFNSVLSYRNKSKPPLRKLSISLAGRRERWERGEGRSFLAWTKFRLLERCFEENIDIIVANPIMITVTLGSTSFRLHDKTLQKFKLFPIVF